jgi:hypothetical protein
MKKLILVSILLLASSLSASVLLTTPYVVSGPAGLVSGYSAPNLTCMGYDWDWAANTMSVRYMFGTATVNAGKDTAFVVAPNFPVITLTVQLGMGAWTVTNGSQKLGNGTLTPGQLTSAVNVFTGPQTALRNYADQFIMATIPGTQPDTW